MHLERQIRITAGFFGIAVAILAHELSFAGEASLAQRSSGELIGQLGADEFQTRQAAMRELLRRGPAARSALQQALSNADAEIRERAEDLLENVDRAELDRTIEAFAAGRTSVASRVSLPGLAAISKILGPIKEHRRLVVEMVRAEPRLLRMLDEQSPDLDEQFLNRAREVEGSILEGAFDEERPPVKGSMAALMVVGVSLSHPLNDGEILAVSRRLSQDVLGVDHRRDPTWRSMSRLVSAWINQDVFAEARDLHFQIGLIQNLPITLEMARRVLAKPDRTPANSVWAMRAVLRYGSEKERLLVEPLLEDARTISNSVKAAQVRDIALMTVLRSSRQNATDYGLEPFTPHSMWGFDLRNTGQYSFASEEKRSAALAKYAEWKNEHAAASAESDRPAAP